MAEGFLDPTDRKLAEQAIDKCDEVIKRQATEAKARDIQVKRFGHDGKKRP